MLKLQDFFASHLHERHTILTTTAIIGLLLGVVFLLLSLEPLPSLPQLIESSPTIPLYVLSSVPSIVSAHVYISKTNARHPRHVSHRG